MKAAPQIAFSAFVAFYGFPVSLFAQGAQAPAQRQQPEFIRQGQQLMREGKLEEALALYRQTLQSQPLSLPGNIAAGNVLDLMGKGEEARKYFQKAIDAAEKPELKATARRPSNTSRKFSTTLPPQRTSSNKARSPTKPLAFALTPAIGILHFIGTRWVTTPA